MNRDAGDVRTPHGRLCARSGERSPLSRFSWMAARPSVAPAGEIPCTRDDRSYHNRLLLLRMRLVTTLQGCPVLAVTASAALRNFLQLRLGSIEQIEIILLLRADPARAWTAPEVAAAVETAQESAAMRLFLLASGGLIAFEPAGIPKYRYAAGDPATQALLTELAELHAADRGGVAALVGAPPDPLRSFADAFKLKK